MISNKIKATGAVTIEVRAKDGELKRRMEIPNLVVTAGLHFLAQRAIGGAFPAVSHLAVGTGGATAQAPGQTQLVAEIARAAIDSAAASPGRGSFVVYATFAPGVATGTWTEAGLFNAGAAGTMIARTTFTATPVAKEADDTITVTWAVDIVAE